MQKKIALTLLRCGELLGLPSFIALGSVHYRDKINCTDSRDDMEIM